MIRLVLALLCLGSAAAGQSLALPEGARLVDEDRNAEGRLAVLLGPWAAEETEVEVLTGPTLRRVWEVPVADTGTLAAGIALSAEAAGYETLYACATRACGGYDFRMELEVAPPPAMFVDLADFRYMALRRGEETVFVLVSRSGGTGFVQVSEVGDAAAASPGPAVAAAPAVMAGVAEGLDGPGRAILEGLRFGSGSAELAPGRVPALEELAAWLAAHPALRLGLVGHTDASGSLEANIALSRRRAAAVRDALVRDYGAPADRLEAQGMGYLAPIASNLTPEGREANRRVEAILLSTE